MNRQNKNAALAEFLGAKGIEPSRINQRTRNIKLESYVKGKKKSDVLRSGCENIGMGESKMVLVQEIIKEQGVCKSRNNPANLSIGKKKAQAGKGGNEENHEVN